VTLASALACLALARVRCRRASARWSVSCFRLLATAGVQVLGWLDMTVSALAQPNYGKPPGHKLRASYAQAHPNETTAHATANATAHGTDALVGHYSLPVYFQVMR